jgi:O-antigen/teichoic acid export membrane protein
VGRLSWGLGDQAVSSLTNFAVGAFVARSLGATAFGVFTLAFVTSSVILTVSRGLATDPLVVRFSGDADERWRAAVRWATGAALTVGVVAGAGSVLVGLALGGGLGSAFLGLGIVVPAIVLQDAWRFCFFAVGQGQKAFVNDMARGIALIPAMFLAARHGSVFGFMLAWGVAGAIAGGFGLVQTGIVPRWDGAEGWLREQGDLSFRYMLENAGNSAAPPLQMYGLGALAGLSAVGAVRGAQLLLGPFTALLMGVSLVAVPEAARVLQRAPRRLRRFCLLLGGTQATGALLWGATVLLAVPDAAGVFVLGGPVWHLAVPLLLPVTLEVAITGFQTSASAGLRALAAARRSLRVQLIGSVAVVAGGVGGAAVAGATGAVWGLVLAASVEAALWWQQLTAGVRQHRASAAEAPTAEITVAKRN